MVARLLYNNNNNNIVFFFLYFCLCIPPKYGYVERLVYGGFLLVLVYRRITLIEKNVELNEKYIRTTNVRVVVDINYFAVVRYSKVSIRGSPDYRNLSAI